MDQQHARPSFWKTPFGIFATLVVVVASVYLWIAHRDHLPALLPFVILAACPLMHVFMHRGHGHGGHAHGEKPKNNGTPRGESRVARLCLGAVLMASEQKRPAPRCQPFRVARLAGYRAAYSQQGIVTSSQQSPPSQQGCAAKTAVEANVKAKIASSFFMIDPFG